jgi:phage terminase large subunit GpA-like protein
MVAVREKFRSFVRTFARYEERLLPSRWCESHIVLPAGRQETEHGPVSFKSRPCLREPLDCIADPTVTDVVVVAPTRGGKTFILRMGWAFSIAGDPAAGLWIDMDEDAAKRISKKELQPLVEANPCLRDRKPTNRHNYTDLQMLFPAAAQTLVGGQSAQQVAGDTVKRIFGNELDKWRGKSDREAEVAELARHRTESFDDERKHLWGCTPTIEQMTTWRYHNRGDQRRWFGPCPRCNTFQQLVWRDEQAGAGVVWSPAAKQQSGKWDLVRVKATARYSCVNPECSAHDPDGARGSGLNDDERRSLVQDERSHWRATAIGEPGWRSYQFNGLYGPKKVNNCGELAVDFLSARNTGFHHDRQDFWNSRMGLPWRDDIALLSIEKFAARECNYLRGEVPEGVRLDGIILGFDVQANRLEYVVAGFCYTGETYTIDHGNVAHWEDLDAIQDQYAALAPKSWAIGDINFEDRRAETLEQIYRRRDRGWLAAEAFDHAKELVRLEKANVFMGGKLQKAGHYVAKLVISAYEFKVELEKRISGEIKNWYTYQLPLAAGDDEIAEQAEYYKQLLDERRIPRKRPVPGKPPFEWRDRGNNHAFDCWVYILALFWSLQKRRAYAARKKPATERQVVEVQR